MALRRALQAGRIAMSRPTFAQANRRYFWVFAPAMALYVVLLFGGILAVKAYPDLIALKVAAALAAALPVIVTIWAMFRLARETDDFNREQMAGSLGLAGGVVTASALLIGFSQMYGLVPQFEDWWYGPLFMAVFGLAQCRQPRLPKADGLDAAGQSAP
jgi:hypothetical protein